MNGTPATLLMRCVSGMLVLVLSGSVCNRALAQSWSAHLTGYAKNLTIRSRSFLTDDAYLLNISRLRVRGIGEFRRLLHAELWLDNELLTGSFLSTPDFKFSRAFTRPTFIDLETDLAEGHNYLVKQSLFRASVTAYLGAAEVTIGRQRIAWGTGFVWNPTDLLNPFNPAAVELDEKQGVDAVHAVVPLGDLSRIEAIYAPGRDRLKSSAALRLNTNWRDYDVSLMAGNFQDDHVLGADYAGSVGGAGFRGEVAYTWRESDTDFLRAIVNADYNFAQDFYTFVEFYYNGQGASKKDNYDLSDLRSGRTFNLARYYGAISVNKAVTPLLQAGVYVILNLVDGSTLLGPLLTYSLADNLELALNLYVTTGADDTEYGAFSTTYFGHLQFYF